MTGGVIETTKGYVYWEPRSDDGGYIEIHNLYVAPPFRNRGYARMLLECAVSMIKVQYPKDRIGVFVGAEETGIDGARLEKFYRRLGLEIMNDKMRAGEGHRV